jgi:hypothetical protein
MLTGDHLSLRTRRRLARSPYAPLEDDDVTQLRVDVLARLFVERLATLGPMSVSEAVDVLALTGEKNPTKLVEMAAI